jgi:hypothetical protein
MRSPIDFRCFVTTSAAFLALVISQREVVQAKKIDGDRLLRPTHLLDIRIDLPPSDWAKLCEQAPNPGAFFSGMPSEDPYTYFKADIWIDGIEIESVGVRKKGFFGSTDNRRPSLKIKFDEFLEQDPIKGLSRLTLNNNKQDKSQVSQLLAYHLFRKAGIHAPRCNLARVTVNREYLGIYSNVESIKKPFLKRHFGDKSGNLYEGSLTDFHPQTVGKLEAKTNAELNDRRDVNRLAGTLAATGELQLEQLEQIIDLDEFFRYWAMESLIGFWDGYAANQNNYYLYFDPRNNRGHFIPWGADWVFTSGGPFGVSRQATTAVYAESILTNRLYHTTGMPDRYRATLQELLDEIWNEQELIGEVDRVEQMIASQLHPDQQGTTQALREVRQFIATRRDILKNELLVWPAEVPKEPRKPMYVVTVGMASGSFATVWGATPTAGGTEEGNVQLKVELDNETVALRNLSVSAQSMPTPFFGPRGPGGFGGPGAPRPSERPQAPVTLMFVGFRAADGQRLTLSLTIEREKFERGTKDAVPVTGMLTVGMGGGFAFGPGGGRGNTVHGRLQLTHSGTNDGDAVAGHIDVQIIETHGGLFGQRPPPGGQPPFGAPRGGAGQQPWPGPPRGQPFPGWAPPLVLRTLDTDGDGRLSAQEIEQAAAALKRLDRNEDGELTGDELSIPMPPTAVRN